MSFLTDRYEVIRGVIPEPLLTIAREYYKIMQLQEEFKYAAVKLVPEGAQVRYCDALSTAISEYLQPLIEERTGLSLLPTYNYTRIYPPGSRLVAHTDRHGNEISATLTISNTPNKIWPLYVRRKDDTTVHVDLEPGDMMIYRGMDLPHWRLPDNVEQIGVFMGWVDANGPYTDHQGDPDRFHSYRNLGLLKKKRIKKKLESEIPKFEFK